MSDVMFYGVLTMPYELAMGSEFGRLQYWQRTQEAVKRIKAAEAANASLVEIAKSLALATDEGDDKAMGTHYVDKFGTIRCKGSFLELIEKARAALAQHKGESNV